MSRDARKPHRSSAGGARRSSGLQGPRWALAAALFAVLYWFLLGPRFDCAAAGNACRGAPPRNRHLSRAARGSSR